MKTQPMNQKQFIWWRVSNKNANWITEKIRWTQWEFSQGWGKKKNKLVYFGTEEYAN